MSTEKTKYTAFFSFLFLFQTDAPMAAFGRRPAANGGLRPPADLRERRKRMLFFHLCWWEKRSSCL